PFRGSKMMIMHQVLHDEPQQPRRLNNKIPRELETVCLKCLEKQPGRRYATAGELAGDLRRLLKGEPSRARPTGKLERGWGCRRNAAVAGLSAAVLLLLALVSVVSSVGYLREAEQRAVAVRQQVIADEQVAVAKAVIDFLQNDLLRQAGSTAQADRQFEPDPN